MGLAVISLLILVGIAIIAIPILIRVFGEAARRNPNQPEGTDVSKEDAVRSSAAPAKASAGKPSRNTLAG